jgi:hypothetical protein
MPTFGLKGFACVSHMQRKQTVLVRVPFPVSAEIEGGLAPGGHERFGVAGKGAGAAEPTIRAVDLAPRDGAGPA